jgi:hypothetical protein
VIRCKNCKGMLHEDDCWYDDFRHIKMQDIACFHCPTRISFPYSDWIDFKKKLRASLIKLKKKNEASKSLKV